ncbi:MAG: DUF3592 domain-containing protein [Anaeromyxobacter sp.]
MFKVGPRRRVRQATPGQVAGILLVMALLFLGFGAYAGREAEAILGDMGVAQGKLLTVERRSKGWKATVEYEAEGSTVFLLHQSVGRTAQAGDVVTVRYERREPSHGTLKTPGELRWTWIGLVALGAAFLVAAAVTLSIATRRTSLTP